MKIIGIEGSSFAGKTTLANNLGHHLDAPIIDEYICYAQPEGFPSFATTKDDLEEQIRYYASLEAKRARDLHEINDSTDIVIVDRTAASLIAFQKTMSNDASGNGFFWNTDSIQDTLLEQKRAGLVINPDIVLLLTAGSQEEHDRRVLERGEIATTTSLNNWNFSEKIRLETKKSLRALGATAIFDCVTMGDSDDIISNAKDLIDWGME